MSNYSFIVTIYAGKRTQTQKSLFVSVATGHIEDEILTNADL